MRPDPTRETPCQDCTNRQPITGACGHASRQALVAYFAGTGATRCPCHASRDDR
ncbi:MAG: hypothetical protein ABEJ23_03205 [Haloarculaceae archaeon]